MGCWCTFVLPVKLAGFVSRWNIANTVMTSSLSDNGQVSLSPPENETSFRTPCFPCFWEIQYASHVDLGTNIGLKVPERIAAIHCSFARELAQRVSYRRFDGTVCKAPPYVFLRVNYWAWDRVSLLQLQWVTQIKASTIRIHHKREDWAQTWIRCTRSGLQHLFGIDWK